MPTQNSDGTWSAKIRDRDFQFSKWGAEKQLLTFSELSKVAAYGLGDCAQMLDEADKKGHLGTFVSLLMKGIGDGMGSDTDRTLRLVKRLCCDDVFCDGKPLRQEVFDAFFREDILFAFEVCRHNLEVQYASFFDRLRPAVMAMWAKILASLGPLNLKT